MTIKNKKMTSKTKPWLMIIAIIVAVTMIATFSTSTITAKIQDSDIEPDNVISPKY